MRLDAAFAGTGRAGSRELYHFDRAQGAWRGPADTAGLERMLGHAAPGELAAPGLKRRIFPSTLWESGARPRRALAALDPLRAPLDGALVHLHTTYLAPLAAPLRERGARVLVDAYDLVWRAHRNDDGPAPARAIRRGYAASVRPRELAALRGADAVVAAGFADAESLRTAGIEATWIPTGCEVDAGRVAPPPAAAGRLAVGFIGNFAHEPTRLSAMSLLSSPLSADPGVELVLAGHGSDRRLARRPGVAVLGELDRPEDLYSRVDFVVAPVGSGSGVKVKLAEAVLAGRPVATTPLGAEGYAPELRRHLLVAPREDLTRAALERWREGWDAAAARSAFEREAGRGAVVNAYARAASRP